MFSKNIKLLFIIFFCFLIFPSSIYSAPLIEVISFPSSVIGGEEFNITFSASLLSESSNYYSKAISIDEDYDVQTWSDSSSLWTNYNSPWSNMPQFTSNSEGSASATLKIRFRSDISSGVKNIKVRIRKTDSSTNYDSTSVSINVTAATPQPTQTPTPTPIITQTPTPTVSLAPTLIPIVTKSPTPRPTVTRTPVSIETEENNTEEEVLGIQYESPISSPFAENNFEIEPKKPKLLAILFIVIGILFIGFAGFAFIKQKGLNNNESDKNQKII